MSVELRTPEMCLAAVQQDGLALQNVPRDLQTPEIYLAAVQQNGLALWDVPKDLRTPEMCLTAVQQNGLALQNVPRDLQTPEMCLAAVQQDGFALWDVPKDLRTPEMCLAAVQQDGFALWDVPEDLRTPEMCLAAILKNGNSLYWVPSKVWIPKSNQSCYHKQSDFYLSILAHDGFLLRHFKDFPHVITTEMCIIAVRNCSAAIHYVPDNLLTQEIEDITEESGKRECYQDVLDYCRDYKLEPLSYDIFVESWNSALDRIKQK